MSSIAENKINKIKNKIAADANNTVVFIKTSKLKQLKHLINMLLNKSKSIGFLVCLTIIIIGIVVITELTTYKIELPHMMKLNDTKSMINITMNKKDNSLIYNVVEVAVENNNNKFTGLTNLSWLNKDIDTSTKSYEIEGKKHKISKKSELSQLKINKNIVYLEYANRQDTANKELILAKEEPTVIDTKDMSRINRRFKEKSNPIQVKTKANSYNNMFIMLTETLAGGNLDIKSLKNEIVNIEGWLGESEKYNGIVLKFDEAGEINLSLIDELKEAPEIIYNRENDIMAVRNEAENIDYFYISKINNDKFGCYAENLIATTNENIFVHEDYDKEDSIGYKTFALKTDNNLYCIRLAEIAHKSLQLNIYKQLGIKSDKIEIKKIQSVIHNKD